LPKNTIFKSADDLNMLKPFYQKGAKYFDKHIDIIGESIGKKLTKEELFKIIPKEYEPIIKFGKDNVVKGIHHMENHHVLLKENGTFKELYKLAGKDIVKEPSNLVFLPDATGKSFYPTNKSLHSGMHAESYYKDAVKQAKKIIDQGKLENWGTARYQEKLLDIKAPMRQGLNKGTTKLNDAKTIIEKVNRKKK
jgi:hypothetical protein